MYSIIYQNLCMGNYPIRSKHTEIHHIIPKYMDGSNMSENLIKLDIRQHKIAHWLLWKIYGNWQDKLVWCMRSGRYEEGLAIKKILHSNYFKEKYIEDSIQLFKSFQNIKNNLPNRIKSNQFNSLKYLHKNKLFKIDESKVSKKRKNCIVINMFNKDGVFLQSFDSVYSANESLNYNSVGNLHSAASGSRNYAAGFRWSFSKIPNVLVVGKQRNYKSTGKQKNPSNHKNTIYKQIEQYDLKHNLLHTWNNRQEIQDHLDISAQMISHVVNGRTKNKDGEYKGFIWKKGKQITIVKYN